MNKTAIIIGGHKRVGLAVSNQISKAGWNVVLGAKTGLSEAANLDKALNQTPLGIWEVDFLEPQKTAADFDNLIKRFSAEDNDLALIINASTFENDDIESLTYDTLHRYMVLHFETPILLISKISKLGSRAQVVILLDQNVINLHKTHLSYCLSKSAMYSALPRLAYTASPTRVNAVAPGQVLPDEGADLAVFEETARRSPLQKYSSAEQIAMAVVYLLDAKSTTGQTIFVDNGQHLQQWVEPANHRAASSTERREPNK
jgi:NAD(P)-dependent dehydrogenase (short-subunit alcohol dehydrogenase family)